MLRINEEDISEVVLNSGVFLEKLNEFSGAGKKQVASLFEEVLNDDEKKLLKEILYKPEGWYSKTLGKGKVKIKFAALSLGRTNKNFIVPQNGEEYYGNVLNEISEAELPILLSVYMKQKLITQKILLNIGYQDPIPLYRGVREERSKYEFYKPGNIESWTSNVEIARRFAGERGFVLSKQVAIKNVFAMISSIYLTPDNPDGHMKKVIRIEEEFIIENVEDNLIIK